VNAPATGISAAGKWTVASVVLFGTFMAVMDVTVVNVALPHMMGTFGQDLSSITWVATAYNIATIIMLTMAGWWSALLGRKRLYMVSFAVFIAGSVLAGTSSSFTQMLVYRAIQGIGGGSLVPVSLAILRETFPREEQGMAMAMYGMGVVLAPAVGPVLGGWLIDHYGWPWIFYINVPVGVLGVLMVAAIVSDPPYLRRGVRRVDWAGIGLLAVGVTGMQVVLERGQQENWFQSAWIVFGTAFTVATLAALVVWELRAPEPVVRLRLLRNVPLAAGSGIGLVFGVALFGTTFILPQFTQVLLGYPALEAGLVLMPRAVTVFLFMPIVGMLYRRLDARLLVLCGIGLICWSYYDLSRLTLYAGYWNLVPLLIQMGAGMPFMFVAMTGVSLSTIRKEDMTDASSIYSLSRSVGGNIGYAVVATLVANGTQVHRAYLVEHVSSLNAIYGAMQGGLAATLARAGLNTVAADRMAIGLLDASVNRQAAMLAYNDTTRTLGFLFLVAIPLLLLLPGRAHTEAVPAAE
jgi:DHA2 family multidrug resistance protein